MGTKLSQITNSPTDLASTDKLVGVRSGTTDYLWSLSQIKAGTGVSHLESILSPDITSAASFSANVGDTGTLYTGTATTPIGRQTFTWSLFGTDAADFDINSSTGVITFHNPAGVAAGSKSITLMVSDGVLSDSLAITATVSAFTATTLDPAHTGTGGTLSGGNLIYTSNGGGASISRSVASHATGKYYFEITVTADAGGGYNSAVGLANSTESVNGSVISQSVNSAALFQGGDGNVYDNNASIGSFASGLSLNDVASVAFDADAKLIWIRINGGSWNNSGAADPASGSGGFTYGISGAIFAAIYLQGTAGYAITCNFGATAYAYTKPAGFASM